MRKTTRRAFRPDLEAVEDRISASSGIGRPVHAASSHHKAPAPKHHPAPRPAAHWKAHYAPSVKITDVSVAPVTITNVSVTVNNAVALRPTLAYPSTGASNQAWIKLVNMTGQDLQYRLSLSPYAGGQFLPFDIAANGPDSVQYRFSSLIVDGHREEPSFAIQFGNGPVTPLNTGISAQAAQGYYILLDSNLNYYVAPFTGGTRA